MPVYSYYFKVPLHDIDAAGVLFFAHLFRHAHDAYESFMSDLGFDLHQLIRDQQMLPLVSSEASFQQPIRHGDEINIQLQVKHIGNSSFTLHYRFLNKQDEQLASAGTTHVHMDPATHKSRDLPARLRDRLTMYLAAE